MAATWHQKLRCELAAGFNRAVIDPKLHARVGCYAIPDGGHGLEVFIHRRLVGKLSDYHAGTDALVVAGLNR